jgi:NAD+ kinase
MKKIGIVVNQNKPGAQELLPKLRDWLQKRDNQVADSSTQSMDEVMKDADILICLGGDGTLLRASSHMRGNSIPILGVNLGALGFLTEVKQDEVFEELNTYFLGTAQIEERLMLSCTAFSAKTKQERRLVALNDIVVSREGLSRILRVEVQVSKEKLTHFAGDGVIIATPTGSTAYSLSAGGAIVHPKLEAIIITPICPHASSLRPMVVAASEKISVRIHGLAAASKGVLTADGQENFEIDDSYTIEITRAVTPLRLIKSSKRSYFASLRENFKFPA